MTPTKNTAPTQVHPIELALVLMLGLLQQLAWLIHTIAVPLIAVLLVAVGYRPSNPGVSVARVPLDSAPVAASPHRTVAQLRQQCRDLGLPSKQWRSAGKATLIQLLAEAPKALEVAAIS